MRFSSKLEDNRLNDLLSYDVLDTPSEDSFDTIACLAKLIFQAPVGLVSLVDKDRQWFKSKQGLSVCETSREISFCTHTINQNYPLVIKDALKDKRFSGNTLVVGPPHIRFYVGAPLLSPAGYNIGSLCVIDYVPREPTPEQIHLLQRLAKLVVNQLELRQLATTDCLTGLLSRHELLSQGNKEFDRLHRYNRPLSVITFDLDNFKKINDTYGHPAGDRVIREVATACKKQLRQMDIIGRIGGEEFSAFLPETNEDASLLAAERMRRAVESLSIKLETVKLVVTASFGIAKVEKKDKNLKDAIVRADKALYFAKQNGRNRCMSIPIEFSSSLRHGQDAVSRTFEEKRNV